MIEDFDLELLNKASLVWVDIQQLRTDSLGEDEFIYPPDRKPSPNNPTLGEIKVILTAFQDEGAIKDIKSIDYGRRNNPTRWSIQIDSHYFKELGKKIKDLYLSKSQEKSEKESISFDDQGLIIEKQKSEQAVRPTGFSTKSILPTNPSAEKIFKSFSPQNYSFILMVIRGILSLTDFSPNGKVHYQLQSPPGQRLINERSLLNRLNVEGLFSYYGEDGIFGIATIGNINIDVLREIESYLADATQQSKPQTEKVTPDTSSRRGLEKKWDVLQAIWTVYEANSRADAVLVPVARVAIKGRSPEEIDGIIDGIKNAGVFSKWERKDRYYNIETIDHNRLPLIYEQVRSSYMKLAGEYEKTHSQQKNHRLQWNDLKLDTKSGRGEYNDVIHVFRPAKPHFKVLRTLLEANGSPVTYDQFFEVVDNKLKNDPKTGKEYIRQKIRDIRKYYGLNRRKNRDVDIFYNTGDGFQLMLLGNSS